MPRRLLKTKRKPRAKSGQAAINTFTQVSVGAWLWSSVSTSADSADTNNTNMPPSQNSKGPVSEYIQATDQPNIMAKPIFDKKPPAIICYEKDPGISKGRKCVIDGEMHFMKYATAKTNWRYQEVYNLLFLQDNLKIHVPTFGYLQDLDLYFATKYFDGLMLGIHLLGYKGFRREVVKLIGEKGVATLMVARTFVADLVKPDNWGYTHDGKVVVIDADGGLDDEGNTQMPRDEKGFYKMAADSIAMTLPATGNHVDLTISMNNIAQMKEIYESLLSIKLPNVHPSVNQNPEMFVKIVKGYIRACDNALTTLKNNNATANVPSEENNLLLENAFNNEYLLVLQVENNSTRLINASVKHIIADATSAATSIAAVSILSLASSSAAASKLSLEQASSTVMRIATSPSLFFSATQNNSLSTEFNAGIPIKLLALAGAGITSVIAFVACMMWAKSSFKHGKAQESIYDPQIELGVGYVTALPTPPKSTRYKK